MYWIFGGPLFIFGSALHHVCFFRFKCRFCIPGKDGSAPILSPYRKKLARTPMPCRSIQLSSCPRVEHKVH